MTNRALLRDHRGFADKAKPKVILPKDENVFVALGMCTRALRKAGLAGDGQGTLATGLGCDLV